MRGRLVVATHSRCPVAPLRVATTEGRGGPAALREGNFSTFPSAMSLAGAPRAAEASEVVRGARAIHRHASGPCRVSAATLRLALRSRWRVMLNNLHSLSCNAETLSLYLSDANDASDSVLRMCLHTWRR
jgi:hypothetical protein